jgi:uncharacterized protein YceK
MKQIWMYFLLLALLSSCGMLQRTTTATEKFESSAEGSTIAKEVAELEHSKDLELLQLEKDSAEMDYHLQLWPKGKLFFSADRGFEGEFDSVKVSGKVKKISNRTEHSTAKEGKKGNYNSVLKQESTNSTASSTKEKQSFPEYYWIVAIAFCLVITIFWHKRRLK